MGANGIYGLSGSSFDSDQINSMVKMGVASHQKRLDKQDQKLQTLQWKKENYLDLTSKISTFNSSTLSQYKMASNMNAKSVESSSSAVKVTANSNAVLMNHKVDVAALSSNAYLISSGEIKRYNTSTGAEDTNSTSIQLKDILFQKLELNSSGTEVQSMETLPHQLNSETPPYTHYQSGSIKLSEKAMSFKISDGFTKEKNDDGTDGDIKNVEISFTYEEIVNGATLNDLVSKINNAGLNIRASYDSVQDKFSLYNSKGGADNKISITSGDENNAEQGSAGAPFSAAIGIGFFNELKLVQSRNGEIVQESDGNGGQQDKVLKFRAREETLSIEGESGSIWVDGMRFETTDNKVTVGGITYTALNTTTTETKDSTTQKYTLDSTANSASIAVSQDTDAIIDKVKSFVEDYNKLLSELYELYDEKPNSDYKPLTKAQKEQMKDEQIEKWENKAKAGMLYHDQTLGKIIMNMRTAIAESVEGINSKYNSAFSLGISTTGLKGQLVLDEDKLKQAIAEDPDAVYNVFATLDSKDLNSSSKSGVAQRLGDISTEAIKKIKDIAGSSSDTNEDSEINNGMRSAQTMISTLQKKISALEKLLYKKYDAMEAAIAQLNSQYNLIAGQMLGQG